MRVLNSKRVMISVICLRIDRVLFPQVECFAGVSRAYRSVGLAMNRPRVLIVDDDPISVEIITEILIDEDFELESAGGGLPAWEKLEASPGRFQAIILDRKMSDLDGLELLGRIKSDPALSLIPVIMVTSAGGREDVLAGLEAGAYYYLVKPFDVSLLCPIVRSAVTECLRYQALHDHQKRSARVCGLMREGYFRFRTLEEGDNLAVFLSNACPVPESVVTGLSELFVNAVEHGNLGIGYEEKTRLCQQDSWHAEVERRLQDPSVQDRYVEVFFESSDDEIAIRIKDQGKGFEWKPFLDFDPDRAFDPHGRGIAMARVLSFETLEYLGCGNEVRVTVARAGKGQ